MPRSVVGGLQTLAAVDGFQAYRVNVDWPFAPYLDHLICPSEPENATFILFKVHLNQAHLLASSSTSPPPQRPSLCS